MKRILLFLFAVVLVCMPVMAQDASANTDPAYLLYHLNSGEILLMKVSSDGMRTTGVVDTRF